MSEDFLKNPLSLFDVKGKTAIVTGATGAFGAVAAKTLAASGANVVITANNADGLKKLAAECAKLGGKSESSPSGRVRKRTATPSSRPRSKIRRPRYPGRGIGPEQGFENRRSEA